MSLCLDRRAPLMHFCAQKLKTNAANALYAPFQHFQVGFTYWYKTLLFRVSKRNRLSTMSCGVYFVLPLYKLPLGRCALYPIVAGRCLAHLHSLYHVQSFHPGDNHGHMHSYMNIQSPYQLSNLPTRVENASPGLRHGRELIPPVIRCLFIPMFIAKDEKEHPVK